MSARNAWYPQRHASPRVVEMVRVRSGEEAPETKGQRSPAVGEGCDKEILEPATKVLVTPKKEVHRTYVRSKVRLGRALPLVAFHVQPRAVEHGVGQSGQEAVHARLFQVFRDLERVEVEAVLHRGPQEEMAQGRPLAQAEDSGVVSEIWSGETRDARWEVRHLSWKDHR